MAARTRSYNVTVPKGQAVFNTGVPIAGNNGSINIESHTCSDIVRKRKDGDCQPLDILHYIQSGGRLNGTSTSARFTNFYPTVYDTWNNFPHHTNLPGNLSDTAVASNAAARTNPSRPYVDVASEVLQMADIVLLIRNVGRSLIKNLAKTNLNYQFGIAPLVGDLRKLYLFGEQLDHRMKEMQQLQSDHGFRKTTHHGTYSASGNYTKTIQSQGLFLSGSFFANTTEIVKCHTRWLPSGDFRKLDDHNTRLLTIDAMLGIVHGNLLNMDLSTIWEALPWSWLIDWGFNVGEYFKATRNIIPCQFAGAYVMRETKTEYTRPGSSGTSGWVEEPVKITRINKYRRSALVAPTAHFPLLSGNQMGILASLYVLRR